MSSLTDRTVRALALAVPLALIAAAPAHAQSERSGVGRVRELPDWSVKEEMEDLARSSQSLLRVVGTLGKANGELEASLQQYLDNPKDALRAAELEENLSRHGERILRQFDALLAEQDQLQASFKNVRRKLGSFGAVLAHKAGESRKGLDAAKQSAASWDRELVRLAVQIREYPPEDPAELQRLKERFRELHMEYGIKQRRVRDLERHLRSRQKLADSFGRLEGLFADLHTKFAWLVENLEGEREYLKASIELQSETMKMRELVRGVMTDGDGSLANVTDRLANAYLQVDQFQKIQVRLTENLSGFVENDGAIAALTEKVDRAFGRAAGAPPSAGDLDALIDRFYEKDE